MSACWSMMMSSSYFHRIKYKMMYQFQWWCYRSATTWPGAPGSQPVPSFKCARIYRFRDCQKPLPCLLKFESSFLVKKIKILDDTHICITYPGLTIIFLCGGGGGGASLASHFTCFRLRFKANNGTDTSRG